MLLAIIFPSSAAFWLNSNPILNLNAFSVDHRICEDLPRNFSIPSKSPVLDLMTDYLPLSVISPPEHRCVVNNQVMKAFRYPQQIPPKGFVRLKQDLYIASPELTFLQAASYLSVEQLIFLGTELCGIYCYDDHLPLGQKNRIPATTKESIMSFLRFAGGCRGYRKALRAASYIVNNSNSRMESILANYAVLSAFMGGFAIKPPEMNVRAQFTEEGNEIMRGRACYIDMLWQEERVACEYDSDSSHLTSTQHYKDKQRYTALSVSGYKVISITKRNISSVFQLDQTFRTIRKALGMRSIDSSLEKYIEQRRQLFEMFQRFRSNDPSTYPLLKK